MGGGGKKKERRKRKLGIKENVREGRYKKKREREIKGQKEIENREKKER